MGIVSKRNKNKTVLLESQNRHYTKYCFHNRIKSIKFAIKKKLSHGFVF